jgi:hypothetical protein
MEHSRAQVAIIVKIFSHRLTSLDKSRSTHGVYLLVRYLKPYAYAATEPYQWKR